MDETTNLLAKARDLRSRNETEEAWSAYRHAVEENPDDVDVLYEAALYAADLTRGEDALELLDRAHAADPSHRGVMVSRAEILSEMERFDEADAILVDLLDRFPDYGWAGVVRVPLLIRMDRLDEAESLCGSLLTFEPSEDSAETWAGRLNAIGGEFAQRQRYGIAQSLYERCIALEPGYAPAYDNLSIIYTYTHRPLEALQMSVRALELMPESPTIHYNLGWSLSQLLAAEASFLKVIELDPNYPDVYHSLARLYAQMEKPQQAEEMLRTAAARYGDAYSYAELASFLFSTGKLGEAEVMANRALDLQADDALAHLVLGDIAATAEDFTEARQRFEEAHRCSPDWWTAAMRLARLHAMDENKGRLLDSLSEAVRLDLARTEEALREDPAFEAFRDDLDVQALIRSAGLMGGNGQ